VKKKKNTKQNFEDAKSYMKYRRVNKRYNSCNRNP
jgi:hypothetical protein